MRLYDTASRSVRALDPGPGPVSIYACGITPYDSSHLGHAFTFHVFDVLTRRLRSLGREVRSVRNVTDVDDDMLRVARERHIDFRALADREVARFDADMSALNLLPVIAPRATAHVGQMVEMVTRLERRGMAYAVDGWVFFDIRRFGRLGAFSRLDPERMRALSAERGADPDDPRKRDPLDFVLWQRSLPDEPSWPSPWGAGRPGWHIECSVLSTAELGTPVDIHGGGDDLIFPHHECEIAQAEAAGITPFVNHWVHVAPVMHEGEKMSKSRGNLVFARELLDRMPAATIRIMLAGHHYRSSWSFDEEDLRAADGRRSRYGAARERSLRLRGGEAEELLAAFHARLDDDLDTPGALDVLDRVVAAAGSTGDAEAGPVLTGMLALLGAAWPAATVASAAAADASQA